MKNETRLRAILALLLVATAALFAVGTTIERSQRSHHSESSATKTAEIPTETATTSSSETSTESSGGADEKASGSSETTTGSSSEANGGADEAASGATEAAAAAETHVEASEKLFGVDTESVPAMIVGIAASLGLAAAVWWRRERVWLWLTLAFGVLFAAGDTREVIHQLNESRNGVATIAAILIAAHLVVAVLAGLILRRPQGETAGSPASEPSI